MMPSMRRSALLLLALATAFALLSGSLTHALVPHEHTHGGEATQIWQDLHATLQHQGRAAFAIVVSALTVTLLVLVSVSARLLAFGRLVLPYDPVQGEALRRGINRYRTFG